MGLTLVIEECLNLRGDGGKDGGVEQRIETGKQKRTDDYGDQNLYAGVHITLGTGVIDGRLGADGDGVDLAADGVDELFHTFITSFFLFVGGGSALVIKERLDFGSDGRENRAIEESVETGEQERTDDYGDQNLYAGIDITFGTGVVDGALGADSDGVYLVTDGVDELFHGKYLVLSFLFFVLDLVLIVTSADVEGLCVIGRSCRGLGLGLFVSVLDGFEQFGAGIRVRGMDDIDVLGFAG